MENKEKIKQLEAERKAKNDVIENLKQELHTSFPFTNPENATKVSSIRLSLHYDFPGDDVQRDFRNRGFFDQK